MGNGTGSEGDSRRQRVGKRNVGCLSGAVIEDLDIKADRVTFGRCAVTAGECFHCDQISVVFDGDGFCQVITSGTWIGLVTCSSGRDVGQRIAALAKINRSRQSQGCRGPGVDRSNREQTGSRVVGTLGNGT